MTDDTNSNQPVDIDTDDNQSEFEDLFFERKTEFVEEPVEEPEASEVEDHEDEDENDPLEPEEADEPEEKPKAKNRKSAQERINELTADKHEERRLRLQLEKRLAELEAAVKPENKVEDVRDVLPTGAPNPDAKDKDGNPVYELGEFDPAYIRDITKFTVEAEIKAANEARERQAYEQAMQAARNEIHTKWSENLDKYEEAVPEARENISVLVEAFQTLDPGYGEYLATAIMAMDNGPAIMDYLSQNIGEAQNIVASGPAAATLALGRLDAKFTRSPEEEPKRNNKRVSDAPEPPEARTRGTGGKFAVAPDTDDQRAFEREFFKK